MEFSFYINQHTILHLDFAGESPKYLQLADAIENSILKGALRKRQKLCWAAPHLPGMPIPGHIIRKAFETLCSRGIITSCARDWFTVKGHRSPAVSRRQA